MLKSTPSHPLFVRVETNYGSRTINLAHVVSVQPAESHWSGDNALNIGLADGTGLTLKGAQMARFQAIVSTLTVAVIEVRPAYCDTPGADRATYLQAQGTMFGAISKAGLDTANKSAMIAAINDLLGIFITSRTQLTPEEMNAVTAAALRGTWKAGWILAPRRATRTLRLRAA